MYSVPNPYVSDYTGEYMMTDTLDEARFVERTQAGDASAFGALYDAYADKIYRFIYYKTFKPELAEDLTSDVFHKALRHIDRFDSEKGTFSQWIYRIARNAVIDHYRTYKTTVPIDDAFDLGISARTEEQFDANEALRAVQEYMKNLPAAQRELLMLRIWDGRSYREIAEMTGSTEDATKMAFSRAIRKLRESCGPFAPSILALFGGAVLPFTTLS